MPVVDDGSVSVPRGDTTRFVRSAENAVCGGIDSDSSLGDASLMWLFFIGESEMFGVSRNGYLHDRTNPWRTVVAKEHRSGVNML